MADTEGPAGLDALDVDLQQRRTRALAMGGDDRVAQQHGKHKLTARERVDLLFDAGTFREFGLLAQQHTLTGGPTDPDRTPADGVVTGEGLIDRSEERRVGKGWRWR